jgi:hypothetical protein
MSSAAIDALYNRINEIESSARMPDFVQKIFDRIFAELKELRSRCSALEAPVAQGGV